MSNDLTKEQKKELKKLADEITETAKNLVEDFANNPSELSGSVHPTKGEVKGHGVIVGMDSQYLKDELKVDEEDNGHKKDS